MAMLTISIRVWMAVKVLIVLFPVARFLMVMGCSKTKWRFFMNTRVITSLKAIESGQMDIYLCARSV